MTIYDTVWPSSYIDQKHQADLLLQRAKILYARKLAITLVRYTEPTQGDWENIYVEKTGLQLPIPVGAKLFWKSLKSGRVLQYGTINDLSNGVASSGKVFPLLDVDYAQPAIRFLGKYDSSRAESLYRTTQPPQFFNPSMVWLPSGTFVYNIQMGQVYYWMQKGLDSLMMIYRCRTADLIATPSPALEVFFNRANNGFYWGLTAGSDIFEGTNIQMPGSATTAALLGTGASNVGSTRLSLLPRQTASDSVAGGFSYGQLWFYNVAQQLENSGSPLMPRENYHNLGVIGIGSYLGATVSEANTSISLGMVVKEDQGLPSLNFLDIGTNSPVAGVGIQSAKVWVYGLFKNATGELSE